MTLDDASFVDLYEVLEVEPGTDPALVRQRISELYLEARENLEHQNHRKRFYFRELYEIHLPHARHILLDKKRRADYDEELQKYIARTGKSFAPRRPRDGAKLKLDSLPGTAPAKTGNDLADDFADFADIESDIVLPPSRPKVQMDAEAVERRRDLKRRELIKHEIIANGFKWGLLGGLASFLGSSFIFLLLHAAIPGGIPAAPTFVIGYIACIVAATAVGARQSTRWARRNTVGYLSTLPYDELLRVCGS